MNEEVLNRISDFLSKWGLWQVLIIIAITLVTLLAKIPIKKAAESYEAKTGTDKSVITWTISVIPFVLGFVAALLLDLGGKGWSAELVAWEDVVKQASVLGTASIGVFEAVKKWGEAASAKKLKSKSSGSSSSGGSSATTKSNVVKLK